jgi:hypothetical protein
MMRVAKRGLLAALFAVPVAFVCDDLQARYKMAHPTSGNPLGAVTFYYATPLKNGTLEVFYDQPQTETCIRSVFPHFGYRPCWYAGRTQVKRIGRIDRPSPGYVLVSRLTIRTDHCRVVVRRG